ncbi:breast cancer type 2 susceptibility protein homolog isoform X2 [Vanessa atalanta]|uniref:breast cancer type 2 susceptibility protein homolog isoform X2 n=1 Tax=Vanessa atalanta TaxID=42275 RepID=UPI001FCE1145|nr:breast cancer type 2 susceptibility protein homolog isoform X2 [Vanessa atalanta]
MGSNEANIFANTLKKHVQATAALYSDNKNVIQNTSKEYKVQDVLSNISKQIKAFQNADTFGKSSSSRIHLDMHKTSNFLPITMISPEQKLEQIQSSKFETQCVLDTQLINIIEDAEALIDVQKDMSQEFDNSFNNLDSKIHYDVNSQKNNKDNDDMNSKHLEDKETMNETSSLRKDCDNSLNTLNLRFNDKCKTISKDIEDKEAEIIELNINEVEQHDELIPRSLIITKNNSPILKSRTPPLVYKLESFEKFETIAVPVINNNLDFDVAKRLINSQIINSELFIQTHAEAVLGDRDKSPSPILSICNKSHRVTCEDFNKSKIKYTSFIEDELLFSSEEEDNFKNDFEELPLTCALETSFYNQHDVLDKTMYVGFQTASNKSIQVHSDSYSKAKSILDNVKVQEVDFSLSKLVEDIESSSKCDNNKVNIKDDECKLQDTEKNECHNKVRSPIGFKTGSGKDIKISEAALMKSKRMFEEVLEADSVTDMLDSNATNDLSCNKRVKLSETTQNVCKNNAELNLGAEDCEMYAGLDEIGLLNELVNIDEHIMNEFESNFTVIDKDKDDNNKSLDETATNAIKTINKNKTIKTVVTEKPIVGFKTANNKKIKISEQGLAKTRNIFEDINLTDLEKPSDSNTEKFDSYMNQPTTSKNFMGFRTATNKRIEVSELALAKTKNIFDNIDDENFNKIDTAKELSVNRNKNKTEVALNKNNLTNLNNKRGGFVNPFPSPKTNNDIFKKPHANSINVNHDLKQQIPTFTGFQTASNKPVQISSEALAKSEKIFKEIMSVQSDESYKEDKSSVRDTSFGNKKESHSTKHDLVRSQENASDINEDSFKDISKDRGKLFNSYQDSSCNLNTKMQGFKTASNKTVPISDEALAKTKSIFQDIFNTEPRADNDDIIIEAFEHQTSSVFEGFKTASNKVVQISETAVAKTRKIFQDFDVADETQTKQEFAFIGFKTGNNKTVKISKESLLKSKQLFEDIDLNQDSFYENKTNLNMKTKADKFGFKTANDKHVNISEKSLRLCQEMVNGKPQNKTIIPELKEGNTTLDNNQLNIDEIMNTEVIKNLEQTLYTEDFSKETSPISKRSGSPILSCPRAKKRRKFKTPQTIHKVNVPSHAVTERPLNTYTFDENYKKNKKYKLKNIQEIEFSNSNNVNMDAYILNFKFDTVLDFEFGGKRNDIDSDVWTTDKIIKKFTESVNRKIVPDGWIENHLKLVIWKLLSYEIRFPNCMKNTCSLKNVLHQLKYRYNRELFNVERPALRKILEKDELASKLMVLKVLGLYVNGVYVDSVTNQMQNIELLVTDGWYCIKACADRMIDTLISAGIIGVGTKLAIYGAELMNCEQGVSPWEDTSSIRLKISGNSTRRAKWDARLGFHGDGAILARLSAVRPEGGKISRVRVFVTRVYPTLYIEKFADGSTVTRSERLEHLQQMKHETERQNQIEKLYDEIEKMGEQFQCLQESEDSEGLDSEKGLDTSSQICRLMKRSKDLSGFKVNLTESQTHLLEEHAMKKREKLMQNLQAKVQDMVKKRGLDVARNVVPLLKMRVADVHNDCISQAMITVWRPNECVLDLIAEGAWLDVYNVVPTTVRFSEVQISAGRQSIFQSSKFNKNKTKMYTDTLRRKCLPIKDLQHITTTDNNEIDTFGLIFLIEPPTNQFQNIYLTDESKNIISINFWGGIKKFGFENILDTGQIVACLNLQKRTGNTRKEIAQYRATEFSHFTRTCKIDFIRKMTEDLTKKFITIDKKKFMNDCVAIKNNFINFKYGNTENVTPYRLNNSDYNVSRNRLFIESPLAQKVDINLNLSGLDFESTFKQTDTQNLSPKELARKRKVNEKIAKLKMYGEPPPLSSIHIINKSNSIKPYKSPLITKSDISINVASATKIPENMEINSSPVLLNRTYVKCINPVKLNFADEDKDGNLMDPFAEEFDCSPPLSLE